MKKLLLFAALLAGCDCGEAAKSKPEPKDSDPLPVPGASRNGDQARIESWTDRRGNTHEYIFYWAGFGNGGGSMTHYPDCKHCQDRAASKIDSNLFKGQQ